MKVCPHCGEEHDRPNTSGLCWDCNRFNRVCRCCNNQFYAPHGEMWCTTCISLRTKECSHCGVEEVIINRWGFCMECMDVLTTRCCECSERVLIGELRVHDFRGYCPACFSNYIRPCSVCGEMEHRNNMHSLDGVYVCPRCRVQCNNCDEWCVTDAAITWDGDDPFDENYLCPHCVQFLRSCECCNHDFLAWRDGYNIFCRSCYQDHYQPCRECGNEFPVEDMLNGYCLSCYGDGSVVFGRIQAHNYRPHRYNFHRCIGEYDSLYMGIELEVDEGGHSHGNAKRIYQASEGHCYVKHDGSLDDGFEIVSHPATLKYHQERMPWRAICSKALELEYRSHDTDTCGLHVHVNRDYFNNQRETVMGMVLLMEKFWYQMLRFSRRDNMSKVNSYARRYNTKEQELTPSNMDHFYNVALDSGRYHAINLENSHTIEFRIFRGTLKPSTIIATLQMVSHIVNTAKDFSIQDIFEMDWFFFMGLIPAQYIELLEYIERRKLTLGKWNGVGIDIDLDMFERDLTRDVG